MPYKNKADRIANDKRYWMIPQNAQRRKDYHAQQYVARPKWFAIHRHTSELRSILTVLTEQKPDREVPLEDLYENLIAAVNANQGKADKLYPHGLPDAEEVQTEFKIGFDRLHGSQLVRNIRQGFPCKIRWAASYDDIEIALRGGENKTRLFESHRDFIMWRYGIKEDTNG